MKPKITKGAAALIAAILARNTGEVYAALTRWSFGYEPVGELEECVMALAEEVISTDIEIQGDRS